MTGALAMIAAYCLDHLLGDPARLPHPVVWIGRLIAGLERPLRRVFPATPQGETAAGAALTATVLAATGLALWAVLSLAWMVHPFAHWLTQVWLGFQALAACGLRRAALAVERPLSAGDLPAARAAVAGIVGRDTAGLDAEGVARATVETVAENASDGVVAPLLYFALGGAWLAWLYKAVNTMDSMVGYKNARYLHFGRAAARLDDAANFVPARLTALAILAAAWLRGLDWRRGWRVFRRDRRNHASPNSAQPEAACAGALGVRLGGDSSYGGVTVPKPAIGAEGRAATAADIVAAAGLAGTAGWLAAAAFAAMRVWL